MGQEKVTSEFVEAQPFDGAIIACRKQNAIRVALRTQQILKTKLHGYDIQKIQSRAELTFFSIKEKVYLCGEKHVCAA